MDLTSFVVVIDYLIRYMTKIFDMILNAFGKGSMFPGDDTTTTPDADTNTPAEEA